jgi:hypothetical protein
MAIMIKMIEDALEGKQLEDNEYNSYLAIINSHNPIKLLEIFEKANDKILYNAERKLLFDAISYEIISYI